MHWSHCNLFVNVRPKYLADVTDSNTHTDIHKVEAVQRRAARYVANNYSCCLCMEILLRFCLIAGSSPLFMLSFTTSVRPMSEDDLLTHQLDI
jgi:hypothetical protein